MSRDEKREKRAFERFRLGARCDQDKSCVRCFQRSRSPADIKDCVDQFLGEEYDQCRELLGQEEEPEETEIKQCFHTALTNELINAIAEDEDKEIEGETLEERYLSLVKIMHEKIVEYIQVV